MAEYLEREVAMTTPVLPKEYRKYQTDNLDDAYEQGWFDALDNLKNAPAVSIPQWISVKDRLPDVNRTGSGYEEITVIATDGERVRPMIYERACVRDKTKCRWKWIWDRIYKGKPIVAWMPLPDPPKGENDG